MKNLSFVIIALIVTLLAGCGGSDGDTAAPDTRIQVEKTTSTETSFSAPITAVTWAEKHTRIDTTMGAPIERTYFVVYAKIDAGAAPLHRSLAFYGHYIEYFGELQLNAGESATITISGGAAAYYGIGDFVTHDLLPSVPPAPHGAG